MDTSGSNSFLLQHARSTRISFFTSVVVLGGIIIAFLFAYAAFGQDTKEGSTLKYISIIFRHGDKNPTSTYSNDPYKDEEFWPEGWGQLTKRGKQQMYQLGEALRARYMQFLGRYLPKLVRVDSSDHDRCHQSAGVLLAALYPPEGDQVWTDQLLWQPIPIHAQPSSSDKLITVKASCPLYDCEKVKTDKELASKYDKSNENLYKYLSENTLDNITSLLDVETLYNILEIEAKTNLVSTLNRAQHLSHFNQMLCRYYVLLNNKIFLQKLCERHPQKVLAMQKNNLTHSDAGPIFTSTEEESGKILPKWTSSVFPDKMKDIAALVLSSFTYTATMKKIKGGPLIRDISTNFRNSARDLSERKLSLYAAHDLTIVSVRRALGFDDLSFKPLLGSAMAFELHKVNGNYLVEVYYYKSFATKEPERWELPYCATPCSLDDFINTLSFVTPVDWDTECQSPCNDS